MYRSEEITKYQTASIPQWGEWCFDYEGTVQYGMHYILGNSQPYFSITASILLKSSKSDRDRWSAYAGGCQHNLIREKVPHLEPLIRFHLCDQDGLPMYYLENGYYWYKENIEIFKSYVRLSEDETIPEVPKIELPTALSESIVISEKEQKKIIETHSKKFITDWLRTRKERLKREFDETMAKFGIEYITQEEIDALK